MLIIGCICALTAIGMPRRVNLRMEKGLPYLIDTVNRTATLCDGFGWDTAPAKFDIPEKIYIYSYYPDDKSKGYVTVDTIDLVFGVCDIPHDPIRYMKVPASVKYLKLGMGGVDTLDVANEEWCFNVKHDIFYTGRRVCTLLVNGKRITTLSTPAGMEELDEYKWNKYDLKSAIVSPGVKRLKKNSLTFLLADTLDLPETLEVVDQKACHFSNPVVTHCILRSKKLKFGDQGRDFSYWPGGKIKPMNLKAWCEDYEFFKGYYWGSINDLGDMDSIYHEQHPLFNNGYRTLDIPDTVYIPRGVGKINYGSFYGCENLKRVVFPESLKVIGYKAFAHTGLQEVIIPATICRIEHEAFSSSYSEPGVVPILRIEGMPEYMGARAFRSIGIIELKSPIPPVIDPELANSEEDSPIKWGSFILVPPGSAEAYKKAPMWNKMIIEEGELNGVGSFVQDKGVWIESSVINYAVQNGSVDIFDLNGSLQRSMTFSGNGTFDMTELGSGAYVVKIVADGLSFSRKVIVK